MLYLAIAAFLLGNVFSFFFGVSMMAHFLYDQTVSRGAMWQLSVKPQRKELLTWAWLSAVLFAFGCLFMFHYFPAQ